MDEDFREDKPLQQAGHGLQSAVQEMRADFFILQPGDGFVTQPDLGLEPGGQLQHKLFTAENAENAAKDLLS
jgi:hypothetical protein